MPSTRLAGQGLAPRTSPEREERGGPTARVAAIAFCLLALIAPAAFFGELVYNTTYAFATGVPAMAPHVILFLLTGLNWLPRRIGLKPLSRGELLTIYGIVLVGAPLVSHSILAWMLPFHALQQYLGPAFPEWQQTYFQYIPRWFAPTAMTALEGLFQGQAWRFCSRCCACGSGGGRSTLSGIWQRTAGACSTTGCRSSSAGCGRA